MDPMMDDPNAYWTQFQPDSSYKLQPVTPPGGNPPPGNPIGGRVNPDPYQREGIDWDSHVKRGPDGQPMLRDGYSVGPNGNLWGPSGDMGSPPAQNQRQMLGQGQASQDFGNLNDPGAWMALVNDPAKLTAWIKQNNPGWNDQLVNYYAGVIKGQPGANPGEQAGSANYYMGKFKADPFYGGQGGGGQQGGYATPGYGSLGQMDTAQFGGINSVTDPGYQFRMSEGLKGIERGAAARGTLLTGGTLKSLVGYASGVANQGYGDDWQRAYQQFQGNYNVRNNERNGVFNRYSSLAQLGKPAA